MKSSQCRGLLFLVIKEREGKVLIIIIIIIIIISIIVIANHHDTILNVSCKDHMYICMNTAHLFYHHTLVI